MPRIIHVFLLMGFVLASVSASAQFAIFQVARPVVSNALLLEDGSYLLLEDASKLLLE